LGGNPWGRHQGGLGPGLGGHSLGGPGNCCGVKSPREKEGKPINPFRWANPGLGWTNPLKGEMGPGEPRGGTGGEYTPPKSITMGGPISGGGGTHRGPTGGGPQRGRQPKTPGVWGQPVWKTRAHTRVEFGPATQRGGGTHRTRTHQGGEKNHGVGKTREPQGWPASGGKKTHTRGAAGGKNKRGAPPQEETPGRAAHQ